MGMCVCVIYIFMYVCICFMGFCVDICVIGKKINNYFDELCEYYLMISLYLSDFF